ncbi:MAG: Ig-like domain-containing protein [Bacteroidaceae bacterium]|nr:Ig-like domain-containing protein [Bacteroidaceae bacterium]
MKGKYWLITAFAMMLAACSKDSGTIDSPVPSEQGNKTVGSTQQPVSFGAYLNRAVTRAGYEGNLGIDQLKTNGFGVLAYYTDDKSYSPDFQPNFMYNTKVAYQTDHWEYNPVRYWPNENSEHDASEGLDRLSFFAYAPHVDVNQLTGYTDENDNPGRGIVALSRNGAIGDPFVYYHVNFNPASQVDFCWGTPRVNMTKQATNQKVEFEFNHALAALNVQIDADIDEVVADASTHIYVRSVSFEGFAERGAFNLNTQPGQVMWHNMTGDDYLDGGKVTVHDGRVNGNEGAAEAVNELPKGLNPVLVQSAKYGDAALTDGVTATAVNLFGENESIDAHAPVYVIPTGQPLKLTIVYDVETQADKLPGYLSDGVTHGTSIENRITKTIALTSGETMRMEAGKHYILNLHLGMTSVKLNATISDWSDGGSGNADLPVNTTIPVPVESISINDPTPYTLIAETDQTLQLSVTVSPNDATNKNVIWSSSDTNIATIDENGIITPISAGTVTITATAEEDESIKDAIDITVTPYPHATGVSVNPAGFSLQIGNTKNLAAVVSPDEALNKAVTWSSSNPSVASVDSNGKVTAVSEGNAVITATTEDGGFTATSQVMVYTEHTTIISKSAKPNPNTVVNYYFEYLKNRIPNGTFTVTSDSPWSSSDETVVAVNEATDMLTPLKHGTTTLTVTSDDGRSNSVKLIVIIPAITLNVIETDVRMSVDEDPRQLNASVGPADADIQTVTWSSSDESVATVDASGKVTAVAPGTAIITATLDQSGILDGLAGEPMQSLSTYYDNEITATTNVTVTAVATLSDLAKLSKDAYDGTLTDASEYLGKYVMQDGSFKDFADLEAAKAGGAVGAVAYVSTDGTDVDDAIPGSRVLVLAVLEKVNNSYDYYGPWTTVLNSDKEGYALGYEYGSNSSYKLLNKAWTYQNGWGQSNHGTDGKGHWFLPSKTQMEKMGAIEKNRTGVWAMLTGNNMSYESSTRNNDYRYCYNSYSHWTSLSYTFGAYIHPVFAY